MGSSIKQIACSFLFFLFALTSFTQTIIEGTVYSAFEKKPLLGVSVYFDGTTIGTTTNENGQFFLELDKPINASLIISYIGYNTIVVSNVTSNIGNIYLEEKAIKLQEVTLEPDTWSREKKLHHFRKEFLGINKEASACKIINEEDIRLYYNSSKQTLQAFIEKPIIIENKHLGYLVRYDLRDFEVQFKTSGAYTYPETIYYAGILFFEELNKNKTIRKYIKNREKAYQGSTLQFMRALANKELKSQNFEIYKDRYKVDSYEYFNISKLENATKVVQTTPELTVLYNKEQQSILKTLEDYFTIDSYGNHAPTTAVYFGGYFGSIRLSKTLPLNYLPQM